MRIGVLKAASSGGRALNSVIRRGLSLIAYSARLRNALFLAALLHGVKGPIDVAASEITVSKKVDSAGQSGTYRPDAASELIQNSRKLHIYRWRDTNQPAKAVIVAVHGTTQHAGSFSSLAQHLAGKGFIFIGLDLRGHGMRFYQAFAGQPNHQVDYNKSVDDLAILLKKVKATYPGLPVFCLGESVGAAVTTHCMARYKGLSEGVILCSPGTLPRVFSPLMVVPDFLKGIVNLDCPMDVSRYIHNYSSDDKRVSDEMVSDPLSRIKLTPKEILRTAFFIHTTTRVAKQVDPKVPVLIVQGEEDGIVNTRSSHKILANLRTEHKEIVEFKDAGHVLLGTSYLKPQVVDSVTRWLCEQADANRSKVIGLHDQIREDARQ